MTIINNQLNLKQAQPLIIHFPSNQQQAQQNSESIFILTPSRLLGKAAQETTKTTAHCDIHGEITPRSPNNHRASWPTIKS